MTQIVVLWVLGIASGILFPTIGALLLAYNKTMLSRIAKNEKAQKESEKSLVTFKEKLEEKLRLHDERLTDRISESNAEVLAAIKELAGSTVHENDCQSRKELYEQRWESWMELQKYKSTTDAKEHKDISQNVKGLIVHVEELSKCITAMQNKLKCED